VENLTLRPFRADRIQPPRGCEAWVRPSDLSTEAPVDLEIGGGVGWWAVRYARENPARHLISIEKTSEKFASFQRRKAAHPAIRNLTAVHADASAWVTHCLGDQTLSRIFILYPNPNPQNPAQRWVRMPFFSALIERLQSGGEIFWATNIESYAEEIRRYSREAWKLEPVLDRSFTQADRPEGCPRTHFEKKYLERGERCFDFVFRKSR
jgi:tRNA G46 methylase TrmB